MVSKNIILLSLLMPIAMVIGTSLAKEFYKASSSILLMFFSFTGLVACVYFIVERSDQHGLSYKKYNNLSN